VLSGFKQDVWAAGVTLWNMTTGTYPFSGETMFALYFEISKAEYVIPDTVDDVLADLFDCLLKRDPAERYSVYEAQHHE
jgi:serine/threonine-protein kinase 11